MGRKEVYELDGYYYINLGKIRDWPEYRIWVKKEFIKFEGDGNKNLYFPIYKATLIKGKRDYVIKDGENIILYIYQKAYYRGRVDVKYLSNNIVNILEGYIPHSPAGSLGISYEALIEISDYPLEFEMNLTGRNRGAPTYFKYIYDSNGFKAVYDDVKLLD